LFGGIVRRTLARVLLLALLATSSPCAPPVFAQQGTLAQAEEFGRLLERLRVKSLEPKERIMLATRALAIERELRPLMDWEEQRGLLWWDLGRAHADLQEGVRKENIERAISAYQEALTIFTRDRSANDWADLKNDLARAYADRIGGDRADNLEKAIAAYEAALTVRTRRELPRAWAETQSNLANVYLSRIQGERADNLEKSITHLQAALQVATREALPQGWAQVQINLGNVYLFRIRGERADNLEDAIVAFGAALTVFKRETSPREWARTENSLGVAYWKRVRGERADNFEKAIPHLQAALTVNTRQRSPAQWAEGQNNLANVYLFRVRGDRRDNLEKAISGYNAALTVLSREARPHDWAEIQNNLGVTYWNRIHGKRVDNLARAIAHFQASLTIKTRDALPREHLRTARLLGSVLLETREWYLAGSAYATAREAFLLLFGQGLNDVEARDIIEDAGPLFAEAAFAAAQRGETERALGLASEGRARLMAVALKLQTLELPADKRQHLDELRVAIRTAESALNIPQDVARVAAIEKLAVLRGELLTLVKGANAAESSPAFALRQGRATASNGAIALPVLTKVGGKIFIVTGARHDTGLAVVDVPELTIEKLSELLSGHAHKDGKLGGWLGAYSVNYMPRAEQDKHWPVWLGAITELGPELWRLFAGQLDVALRERGVQPGSRLIWLPSGALGILPLGLAQDPAGGRYLADTYEIVYAPSLDVLTTSQDHIAKAATSLALIANPTGDLPGTEKEATIVASHFASSAQTVLQRNAATPAAVLDALKGKDYWHFASHGMFCWRDARLSGLIGFGTPHEHCGQQLGGEPLTVARLLEAERLGRPRLVVLSACETGLYDIGNNYDEFIGLPGTFLALGAAGVLGTLWPVSDAATALLIAKFYELHMDQRVPPPAALNQAQTWLRQATNSDLQSYARIAANQGRLTSRHMTEIEQELSENGLKRSRNKSVVEWSQPQASFDAAARLVRPYAHPYFWAGFIHTGL